jgi:Tfp pilus assembly protein PilO
MDKTGNYGIPVIIELNGAWESIGQDLQEIQKLPFLLRAISIDAEPDKENESMIQFKYGGFLYVDTRLGEN